MPENNPRLPTAQEVLAIIAAEHAPYDGTSVGRPLQLCSACSESRIVPWPCRVHRLATQRTSDLAALGMRQPRGVSEGTDG